MEKNKTRIKLVLHAMGWEIDHLLTYFIQLKKSKYYIPKDIEITIDVTLNLSDYFINWEESKLPKEFFIDKFKNIKPLLNDYNLESKIIHTGLYGHLNSQKDAIDSKTEYYILSTPDICFSEHLLAYYIEAIKNIKNEYFLVCPQITKLWDDSWDIITDPLHMNTPYDKWQTIDIFDVIHKHSNPTQEVGLKPLPTSKFAGWFDICNKKFYEELVPVWDEWEGYGGWDYYSMMVSNVYKQMGGDFQQYLLAGQTTVEYSTGPQTLDIGKYYKKYLVLNKLPYNQGELFKTKVVDYVKERISKFGVVK
jgi:hypothetical protein